MKLLLENWKRFINEAKGMVCPKPTQDLELNTKNRNAAIQAEHIQYGPLNGSVPVLSVQFKVLSWLRTSHVFGLVYESLPVFK